MVGQQADASQSFGSGLTYVYRYFPLKHFGVSTVEDDPDNWRAKQREAEEAENRAIAGCRRGPGSADFARFPAPPTPSYMKCLFF